MHAEQGFVRCGVWPGALAVGKVISEGPEMVLAAVLAPPVLGPRTATTGAANDGAGLFLAASVQIKTQYETR